jgi:S-(hydroxymethyl)glutathione dehydrogenase/alcohol dehydrogenase
VVVKGIVYLGDGKAQLTDELALREPGPYEVVVRMIAAGLCHTDLSVLDGTIPWPAPAAMGHEGAGIVERVGEAVSLTKPGDHIVVSTIANCGTCRMCNTGHPTRCRASIGNRTEPFEYRGRPCSNFAATSSLAERTMIQEIQAVVIPDDVPFTSACLIACGVMTGVGSVWNAAGVARGDTVVVFGVGGVGLSVIQAAAIAGASRVVAVDVVAAKEVLARRFGATDFVDAAAGDVVTAIRELFPFSADVVTGPFGAGGVDWAFECTGNPAVLRAALEVLEWGGTAVAVGVPGPGTEVGVPVNPMVHLDRRLMGVRYGEARPRRDIPLVADMYRRGRFELDAMVSAVYPLDDWSRAFHDLEAGKLARGVIQIADAP